ncbi:hypothetical protein GCM10010994_17880 [Chelatococcus reniformis]|uniref:Uncharacterized protein n=1 Tax=Chelatococcus reniformis TaxID=1494448 RepID=A0A916XC19_9HYPH|nr:hypothetical protein GCM10010994_17880 [Chelatococcus reniformis]
MCPAKRSHKGAEERIRRGSLPPPRRRPREASPLWVDALLKPGFDRRGKA